MTTEESVIGDAPVTPPAPPITGMYRYPAVANVYFGQPAAKVLAEETARRNARRIVVVANRSMLRVGAVHTATQQIDYRMVGLFADCPAHTPREAALSLAEMLREIEADLVISVGGGSVIDTVKVALMCMATDITHTDQFDSWTVRVSKQGKRIVPALPEHPLRQIAVPTGLSAAEFHELAGCTDTATGQKHFYGGGHICPDTVVLDPEMTVHTPARLWLSTGVRAVERAVDAICAPNRNPMIDASCLHALSLLADSLPVNRTTPDDLGKRLDSQLGAWLATSGINRHDIGVNQSVSHVLGAALGLAHGVGDAALLPALMAFNEEACPERHALISKAMGKPTRRASKVVRKLVSALGLPTRLRHLLPDTSGFEAVSINVMSNPALRANVRPITDPEQVREILDAAW
ncbi:iron-containing alcohol dehydrogenase [Pigmentiphaga aceris]|nr:iron-containing alcohol dehydrogenase [Pigmentiphaga aceris]